MTQTGYGRMPPPLYWHFPRKNYVPLSMLFSFNDHPRNLKSVSPPHVKLVCFPFLSTDSPTNKRKKGNLPFELIVEISKNKLKIKQATWPHKLDPACTQRTLLRSETFFSLVHLNPEVYTICKKIFYWHTREVFAPLFFTLVPVEN